MTINPEATASTDEALDMLEDVSARARAMNLGLVAYPVEDVEAVCAALRAVRGRGRVEIARVAGSPATPQPSNG